MNKRITSHLLTHDRDNIILGRGNQHNGTLNKTTINKLQSIPWEINENILHLISDKLKPSEEKLSAYEQRDRENAFILRDQETDKVIDYLLENGNKFYFGWKYDKRGRSYSQGYHVNPQGNEYRKAMLRFSNKEVLTKSGTDWLRIDIANCYGYDKDIWFKRRLIANRIINDVFYKEINGEKYNRNYGDIEAKIVAYAKDADTPLLFIKAMYAWLEGVIDGKPIGHNMGLDGTASGLQFMSAMSGCVTTAQNSNVHAKIERIYTDEVAERLAELEAELASL